MTQYESILSAASRLSVDERLRLIDDLAGTVPDDRPPSLSPEWLAEIERRSAEIDAGTITPVPWETVRKELFGKVGLDRAH
jgi:putative addiction module component (TIGR02574 family)